MEDKVQSWFWKIVKFLFLLQMGLIFLAELLRSISAFQFYLGVGLTIIAAYVVYTHRHPHEKRPRSSSGSERTPVMPRRDR